MIFWIFAFFMIFHLHSSSNLAPIVPSLDFVRLLRFMDTTCDTFWWEGVSKLLTLHCLYLPFTPISIVNVNIPVIHDQSKMFFCNIIFADKLGEIFTNLKCMYRIYRCGYLSFISFGILSIYISTSKISRNTVQLSALKTRCSYIGSLSPRKTNCSQVLDTSKGIDR